MNRRPPRSTRDRSSAASDVYKRQADARACQEAGGITRKIAMAAEVIARIGDPRAADTVSYTHLRAHETVLDIVCRLLLEKKKLHARTEPATR